MPCKISYTDRQTYFVIHGAPRTLLHCAGLHYNPKKSAPCLQSQIWRFPSSRFDRKTFKSQLEQVNGFKGSGINDRLGFFCQKVILQGMFRILFFQTETDGGYLHL